MDLLKKDYNAKITEIDGKIPSISALATILTLTAVENKIPSVIYLKKQIMTLRLLKSKRNLLIITMINILQLQSLIL